MCDPDAMRELLSDILKRRTLIPTTLSGRSAEDDTREFARLANYGGARNISNPEFTTRLGKCSGFPDQVDEWMYKGVVPNGMIRAIILACAAELNEELRIYYEEPAAA